jgi:hypothetical protein
MNSSPERGTFQLNNLIKKVEEGEKSLEDAQPIMELFKTMREHRVELEETEEWKKDNMEYDLRSTKWICDKAKASEPYAQNIYAAICNNDFTKNEVWPLLQGKTWSASWRSAGGIVANMVEEGDYMDWYCSGIRNDTGYDPSLDVKYPNGFVPESVVTDEIRADLLKLGWLVVDSETTENINNRIKRIHRRLS